MAYARQKFELCSFLNIVCTDPRSSNASDFECFIFKGKKKNSEHPEAKWLLDGMSCFNLNLPCQLGPFPMHNGRIPVQLTSVREATDKEGGGARTGTMDG